MFILQTCCSTGMCGMDIHRVDVHGMGIHHIVELDMDMHNIFLLQPKIFNIQIFVSHKTWKCTGRSREAELIFLFGLEALLTRDYRVLSCAISSSPKQQAAIGYYSDQTQFLLATTAFRPVFNPLLSTCGPWENTALLKCRHPHCVALSFYKNVFEFTQGGDHFFLEIQVRYAVDICLMMKTELNFFILLLLNKIIRNVCILNFSSIFMFMLIRLPTKITF